MKTISRTEKYNAEPGKIFNYVRIFLLDAPGKFMRYFKSN